MSASLVPLCRRRGSILTIGAGGRTRVAQSKGWWKRDINNKGWWRRDVINSSKLLGRTEGEDRKSVGSNKKYSAKYSYVNVLVLKFVSCVEKRAGCV